jgi:hypothetical protein
MKRALEQQRTSSARKRRRLVPMFVCAVIDGPGSSEPQSLAEFVDLNVLNIKTNSRGRQPIMHTPTSNAKPRDLHPSGAHLAHVITTAGIAVSTCKDAATRAVLRRECKREAQLHHRWTHRAIARWFSWPPPEKPLASGRADPLTLFYTWDVNRMRKNNPMPELAQSTARIVAINATYDNKAKRYSVVLDNGNVEHMVQCMTEGDDHYGILCYAVVPPQNRFMADNIRNAARAGRCLLEKICKLLLEARVCNCPIRISHRAFDPRSAHYIPELQAVLRREFPNFIENLVALQRYYRTATAIDGATPTADTPCAAAAGSRRRARAAAQSL